MVVTHMKNMLVTAIVFYPQLLFSDSNVVTLRKFILATAALIDFLVDPVIEILISDILSNWYMHSIYQSVLFFITILYRILQLLCF